MERKLASVQKITAIEPIEGADKIELVRVLGWQCVTQKSNNFKPGDLCCYIEIDSVCPTPPGSPLEFLKKKPEDKEARLRTIRLKGKLSQGLVLPLEACVSDIGFTEHIVNGQVERIHVKSTLRSAELPAPTNDDFIDEDTGFRIVKEGEDITDWFGITKYEPPIPANLRGKVKGQFPYFLVKTDETRIQSAPGALERHKGELVYITEKLDGSSFTAFYYPKELFDRLPHTAEDDARGYSFGICSRSIWLDWSEDNSFCKCSLKYDMENKLKGHGKPIAIQGEMFGDGIQHNKLQQPGLNFRLFNVYDLDTKTYLGYNRMIETATNLQLATVPILATNLPLDFTVDQLVTMSINKSTINPKVWQEGIVVRPMEEGWDKDLGRFSFKVINPEFLLKFNE